MYEFDTHHHFTKNWVPVLCQKRTLADKHRCGEIIFLGIFSQEGCPFIIGVWLQNCFEG
jgi:hypothetical protein